MTLSDLERILLGSQKKAYCYLKLCICGSLTFWAWIWKTHSSRFLDTLYLLLQIRSSNHRCKCTLPCVELMLQTAYEYVCVFLWCFCYISLKSSGKWVELCGTAYCCQESAILKEKIIGENFHFRCVFKDIKFSQRGKLIFVHFNC